jgi:hypothetical protein
MRRGVEGEPHMRNGPRITHPLTHPHFLAPLTLPVRCSFPLQPTPVATCLACLASSCIPRMAPSWFPLHSPPQPFPMFIATPTLGADQCNTADIGTFLCEVVVSDGGTGLARCSH